jgi:predicted dehydrogenase
MTIRIIQIGTGIRGRHWLDFVKAFADTSCVAVVESDAGNLEKAKPLLGSGCRTYRDLDTALAEAQADAALIVSPDSLHADQSIRCLEKGLTIMVEKPFTPTVADAAKVLHKAAAVGKQVIVAEQYRFWAAERTVKKLLEGGTIGRVDHCQFTDRRNMPASTEGPWLRNIDYPQLQAIAVHHFDSLRMWFGEPRALAAKAWRSPWSDYQGCENTQAQVDFGNIQVQYLGTMRSPRYECSIRIEGEQGAIWTNRRWVFVRKPGGRFFRPVKNVAVPPGDERSYPQGGTTALLLALRDAVRNGTPGETSGQDNIWSIAMVEAAKRAMVEARAVKITEVGDGHFVGNG